MRSTHGCLRSLSGTSARALLALLLLSLSWAAPVPLQQFSAIKGNAGEPAEQDGLAATAAEGRRRTLAGELWGGFAIACPSCP